MLFEHQSTVEPLLAFRLLRYMVRIWERHLTEHPRADRLPPILPMVLHHSTTGWTAATSFQDVLDLDPELLPAITAYVPSFRFLLDDISHEDPESLRARAMTALGRLVLYCLRFSREPDELVARFGAWIELRRELRRAPNGVAALMRIWRYIWLADRAERPEEVLARLLQAIAEDEKEEVVTAGEQLIERGRQQGEAQGERQGERRMLLKLLASRFGTLPADAVARVNAADVPQLELWGERVLVAATLADVLGEG